MAVYAEYILKKYISVDYIVDIVDYINYDIFTIFLISKSVINWFNNYFILFLYSHNWTNLIKEKALI